MHILSVCFVALAIKHAKRMRHIVLSSVACPAVPYFSTLCHKWHNIRGGGEVGSYWAWNVFWYYVKLLSQIFLILLRIQCGIIVNVHRSLCKVTVIFFLLECAVYTQQTVISCKFKLYSCQIFMKLKFSRQIFRKKNAQILNLTKIRAVTEWVELYLYSHYTSHDVDRNKFIHVKHCVRECIQAMEKRIWISWPVVIPTSPSESPTLITIPTMLPCNRQDTQWTYNLTLWGRSRNVYTSSTIPTAWYHFTLWESFYCDFMLLPKIECVKSTVAVAYRGGLWGVQPPPRTSEGPPKSCQTQPDCENC